MRDYYVPFLAYSRQRRKDPWPDASDRELLRAIRAGETAAFDELIQRKTGPLMQAVFRLVGDREEAKDILQLTFLRVWEHGDRFDERWSPNTWLYRIATNLAIDHLRASQRRRRALEPVGAHLRQVSATHRDLSQLEDKEVEEIFRTLSTCLSEKQRVVFVLRAIEGLDSRQVAAILGCRASTVRNHLFTARKKLRQELKSRFPEYAMLRADPQRGQGNSR
jgi:RNA polymerase sigma-70 factor (ECF subfamily)